MDFLRSAFARVVTVLLVTLAVLGCSHKQTPDPSSVDGQYQPFESLFPHSLDTVHLDVYEDFTCPACQQFANDFLPPLRTAYGGRIDLKFHYLVGYSSPVSAQVLYEVAASHGLGEEAARRLFAAKLDHHSEEKNSAAVARIAGQLKLLPEYEASLRDPKTTRDIRAAWNHEGAHITFFPSIVIEHVLLTDSNPQNLAVIINSLLKKPMVELSVTPTSDGKVDVSTDQAKE